MKKWCSKSRYVGFWIFVFKKCNFTILQKLSTLFFKLTLCMEKNEFFFVFFHSFSPWLTSRNFTFFNHFYHTSEWHPPPIVLLRKRQKVSKFYLLVFRQKLENRSLHAENDFFKIFEKNVPMGILTKISQNLPGV